MNNNPQLSYLMNKKYVIKSRGLFKNDVKPFRISRTQIEAFVECPRCFYLNHCHGIRRPSMPGWPINSLVDRLLKKEFDAYRLERTAHPIMIKHDLDAVPFQHALIDDWRKRPGMTWLDPRTNLLISGLIDDIWQYRCNGQLIVVDYKATAKNGEVTLDDEWKISYKRQMEIYIWLLRKQDLDVDSRGFFLYANGHEGDGFDQKIEFNVSLLPYIANCDWIEPVLLRLKECLTQAEMPPAPADCEFCGYIAGVAGMGLS
jgi:PD-(D/E)XK nuclease superfamily